MAPSKTILQLPMLTLRAKYLISKCFSPPDQQDAEDYITLCADQNEFARNDRIQIALIRSSGGTIEGLIESIDFAEQDWRDLLVGTHFAELDNSWLTWEPDEKSS